MGYSPSSGGDFESRRHKRRISGQTKCRSFPSAAGVAATWAKNCLDPVAHLSSIALCLHGSVSQQKLQKHRERNLLKLRQLCRTSHPYSVQALHQTKRRERQGSPTSTEPPHTPAIPLPPPGGLQLYNSPETALTLMGQRAKTYLFFHCPVLSIF